MAFYVWLGNIIEVRKAEIQLANFETQNLPKISNPEWENMLMQIFNAQAFNIKKVKTGVSH